MPGVHTAETSLDGVVLYAYCDCLRAPKAFGEYLKGARMDPRLHLKDVAQATGVREDSIINWEHRGRVPVPRLYDELAAFYADRGVTIPERPVA